jgi:anti-sigma factor RsiW
MSNTVSQGCPEWEVMMHGFIDGELDSIHAQQFEQHLATCADCATQLERFKALKHIIGQDGVRWRVPDPVRDQILTAILLENQLASQEAAATVDHTRVWSRIVQFIKRWSYVPSFAALAASVFLVLSVPRQDISLQDQILASHVRSLLVNHLTDVQTSDQHTVKPWFDGKIDYSPPVVDLAAQGFPLIGGRVDYINGRVVAALIYRRHGHVINVFAWPAPPVTPTDTTHDGYNFVKWSSGGLTFWAVSDVSATELAAFRQLFSEGSGK